MAVPLRRRRFTVEDYHRMISGGVLGPDDRVELIEGEIVEKMPIGSRHAACVNRLNRLLVTALGDRAVVAVQNPVKVSDLSEPEPDIAVLKPRADDYAERHPEPADVLLLIEVSDASLAIDREIKAPLYALAGISELWVVNLQGDVIELFRDPAGDRYRDISRARPGETLRAKSLPDVALAVEQIL